MSDDLRLFAAQLRHDLPTLDLHGLYPDVALEQLELFLYNEYEKKETAARVVYGIGTGKLRAAVLDALRKNDLVESVTENDGSCTILLRY